MCYFLLIENSKMELGIGNLELGLGRRVRVVGVGRLLSVVEFGIGD